MPTLQSSVIVAANSTVENVFIGSQFEFAPYDASIEIGVNGSAIGIVADVSTGQDVVAENFSVAGVNRFPIMPDDFLIADVVKGGERVKLRVRNTTAGALTAFFTLRMFPLRR